MKNVSRKSQKTGPPSKRRTSKDKLFANSLATPLQPTAGEPGTDKAGEPAKFRKAGVRAASGPVNADVGGEV